jgi:hypothetical protein
MKYLIFIACLFVALHPLRAQTTTKNQKETNNREPVNQHKIMLIPFEPKLYMSEIDRAINAQTGQAAKQIKHKFRDGLNEQLYKAFKAAKYGVVDLMDDTVKYRKDLEGIYQYLNYSYQKLPNHDNYKAPITEKEEKKIEKGQLNVETNSEARFMNAKLSNPKIIPQLYTKHKTDVFLFINQLDIKAAGSPSSFSETSANRKIVVHYTVFTNDAKEINSGIAELEFEPELNNPKKIIDTYFSKLATVIVLRVNKGLGIGVAK